mgnify:CR=1 FL=1
MKVDHPPIHGHGKAPHSTAHKMHHEHLESTYDHGGHVHHSDHFMKHSAGHQFEQDKVKAMCGGGKTK